MSEDTVISIKSIIFLRTGLHKIVEIKPNTFLTGPAN